MTKKTLKSISPEASSDPVISERINGVPSPPNSFVSKTSPIAMPAIEHLKGTPASNNARQPPQTDAILVMRQKNLSHLINNMHAMLLFSLKIQYWQDEMNEKTYLTAIETAHVCHTPFLLAWHSSLIFLDDRHYFYSHMILSIERQEKPVSLTKMWCYEPSL